MRALYVRFALGSALCVLLACGDAASGGGASGDAGGQPNDASMLDASAPALDASTAEPDAAQLDASTLEPDAAQLDAGDVTDASSIDSGADAATPPKPDGEGCDDGSQCDSGFCVDDVCCEAACDGTCDACAEDKTGEDDGTCAPVTALTDPDDECDVEACMVGSCDGAGACEAVPDGMVCRAIAGSCDLQEVCAAGACPADAVVASTESCRAATGPCDVAELCDGVSAACPADSFVGSTVECRPSAGACDMAELCSGSTGDCPSDVLASNTVTCRPSAGACDLAETCTGAGVDCPTDLVAMNGVSCRAAAGACDLAETCNGTAVTCPADLKSTAVCRTSAGTCDIAESCNGTADTCPPNGFLPSSATVCTGQYCTGLGAACVACRNDMDCNNGDRCTATFQCVTPKRVFSTSTAHNGNYGGLAGADAFCQMHATDAGLSGTYRAWMSSDTVSAASRLTHATVPYYTTGGVKIADDWNDLVDGTIDAVINVNELGATVPGNIPFTGTGPNGSIGGATCSSWTHGTASQSGLTGASTLTNSAWTSNQYRACDTLTRLFCFEQ